MLDDITPIQDTYNPQAAICYGCGISNPDGLHIKTRWDGKIGHCTFLPRPQHTAFPNVVYGGLLASLVDCHSIGTAIAAMHEAEGIQPSPASPITCVTGNLNISYKHPTPTNVELKLEATIKEMTNRKAIVVTHLYADGKLCVIGETVAVRVSSRMMHQ